MGSLIASVSDFSILICVAPFAVDHVSAKESLYLLRRRLSQRKRNCSGIGPSYDADEAPLDGWASER